jgi:hypothetical protein
LGAVGAAGLGAVGSAAVAVPVKNAAHAAMDIASLIFICISFRQFM